MSTAFIIASVFLTGSILCHRDAHASNTLFFLFIFASLAGIGIWVGEHHAF